LSSKSRTLLFPTIATPRPASAAAVLADYWIANIRGRCFKVLRVPGPSDYRSKQVHYPGDLIHPLASPELAFPVSLIFPDPENGENS
jgi:Uma2 family endonuclease